MARWRANGLLVTLLTGALPLAGAAALAHAYALGARLVVLGDPGAGDFRMRARDADTVARTTAVVLVVSVVVVGPVFVTWMWRAARNQQVLHRGPERLGSGWAIGGWFVPLANVVIPVLVVQDLWRGSDAAIDLGDPRWRIADRSWLVGWWWGLLLGGTLAVVGAAADQPAERISTLEQANVLALLGSLSAAVAAVLGVLVVRRITERQTE